MLDQIIAGIASLQYGLFSRTQVLDVDGYDQLIERRLAARRWIEVHPGVYSLPGWPPSWHRDLWAMYLALGEDAVVSFDAATTLHLMYPFPRFGRLEFSVPHGEHIVLPNTIVHQPRDLTPDQVTLVSGMRVTTVARTLCDQAARSGRERLKRGVEQAHLDRKSSISETLALYERLNRPGKRGFNVLGQILSVRAPGFVVLESELERLFRRLLRKYDIAEPDWQVPLPWDPKRRCDGAWLDRRVLLELDSRTWHARVDQMTADRRRDREARRHGYDVHRFTYEEVRYEPNVVLSDVRDALALAA